MMTKEKFDETMGTIANSIKELPEEVQPGLMEILRETAGRHEQILESCRRSREGVKALVEAQAELSLRMKYILFDLECLHRELER
ncbi:hypothetical protein LCGC14_0220520 [marine sediment metagenome]|uniref:Uncharacterized protein n=1 Tax=marine sediment metagenome TaxID=412755 RepID=A0A0F9WXM5_9ZZZZ